jgi:hypothetical protein
VLSTEKNTTSLPGFLLHIFASCPSAIICLQTLSLHAFFSLVFVRLLEDPSCKQSGKKKAEKLALQALQTAKVQPAKKSIQSKKRVALMCVLSCVAFYSERIVARTANLNARKKKAKSHSLSLFFLLSLLHA